MFAEPAESACCTRYGSAYTEGGELGIVGIATFVILPFVRVIDATVFPHGVEYALPVNVPDTPEDATTVVGCVTTGVSVITICDVVGSFVFVSATNACDFVVAMATFPLLFKTARGFFALARAIALSREDLKALLVIVAPETACTFAEPTFRVSLIKIGFA